MLESSSVILPYFHKPNLVDLPSFSGVLFTSLLLLILDIGEDIVTLKISLDNVNERSVWLSTYWGDLILHWGKQKGRTDHLLTSPGRHNSQAQAVTFFPVSPLWLPATDSKKRQIFPPVILFFSVLHEERFLLWHFSTYISQNYFIKVFVCLFSPTVHTT